MIERYRPQSFSEHLAWSTHDSGFLNDLLPLPYTEETLARVSAHVDQTQQALGRRMLLENPSTYLLFEESTIDEIDFLAAVSDAHRLRPAARREQRDGVGGEPPARPARLTSIASRSELVGEVHLAGYDETVDGAGERLLIDAHGTEVKSDVFALYEHTLRRTGPLPTLVEWDNNVPDFPVLFAEAQRVDAALAGEASRRNLSHRAA